MRIRGQFGSIEKEIIISHSLLHHLLFENQPWRGQAGPSLDHRLPAHLLENVSLCTKMMSSEIQVELSKTRTHTSSNLAHEKKPAQLLVALEWTIQSTPGSSNTLRSISSSSPATPVPSACFAAMPTTLEGATKRL